MGFFVFPFFVCMVYACVCLHMCVTPYVYMWSSEVDVRYHLLFFSTLYLSQCPLPGLETTSWLDWLTWDPPGSSHFHALSAEATDVCGHSWFCMGPGDQNQVLMLIQQAFYLSGQQLIIWITVWMIVWISCYQENSSCFSLIYTK